MTLIAPSILSADFSRLGEEIIKLNNSGADLIHVDIMDGSFVPNITFGPAVVKSLKQHSKLPFDVHLMVEDPSKLIDEFQNAGAEIITVHYEADRHIDRTIDEIKSRGLKAGIAINPGTPVNVIQDIIKKIDMLLIMSVNPGFGGQKFIDYSLDKISKAKLMASAQNQNLKIEVDGGIDENNIRSIVEAGADIIVAGTAIFRDGKLKENICKLREVL